MLLGLAFGLLSFIVIVALIAFLFMQQKQISELRNAINPMPNTSDSEVKKSSSHQVDESVGQQHIVADSTQESIQSPAALTEQEIAQFSRLHPDKAMLTLGFLSYQDQLNTGQTLLNYVQSQKNQRALIIELTPTKDIASALGLAHQDDSIQHLNAQLSYLSLSHIRQFDQQLQAQQKDFDRVYLQLPPLGLSRTTALLKHLNAYLLILKPDEDVAQLENTVTHLLDSIEVQSQRFMGLAFQLDTSEDQAYYQEAQSKYSEIVLGQVQENKFQSQIVQNLEEQIQSYVIPSLS